MVDSNDRERIWEAKEALHGILADDELAHAELLVLANKQDLPNAMTPAEVTEMMDLPKLRNRNWYVQSTVGTTGEGLYQGLDWLTEKLEKQR